MKSRPIFDLLWAALFLIPDGSKCQTRVRKLPPRLPNTARFPKDPSADIFGLGESLQNNAIEAKRVVVTAECNNDIILEDGEGVLVMTPIKRLDMNCVTTVRAKSKNYILNIYIHSNELKFGCNWESLTLTMDFTIELLCRGGTAMPLVGRNLTLAYKRKITERFGSYAVSVVSMRNKNEEFKSVLESYILQYNCGINKYSDTPENAIVKKASLQPRIVGGEDAIEDEHPWMAYLTINAADGAFSCGGSLISRQHILTAAHCLPNNTIDVSVTLGRQDLTNSLVGKTVVAKVFKRHELFDEQTVQNDIALLKLSTIITFTDSIKPICLPSSSIEDMSGEDAIIVGFGQTDYYGSSSDMLQEATVKIWKQEKCNAAWSTKFSDVEIVSSQICALGTEVEDSCLGDSGGPLISETFERKTLLGITSFGDRCSIPGIPGVYTRVSNFNSWLDRWMAAL